MICPKCNQETDNNGRFCEHCGAQIVQPAAGQQTPVMQQPSKQKKPLDKRIIAAAAAVVVVLILVIVLVKTHKTTIDLQDYTTVTFDGYDNYGDANLEFDYDRLMEDFADASGFDDVSDIDSLSDIASETDASDYAAMINLFDKLSYELDKTDGLKNGDTVTVSYTFDNDTAKQFGVKFKGDALEFTVAGLEEIREVDPFENLSVEFSGTSPNARVTCQNNSTEEGLSSLNFQAEPSSGLTIGDKVTVTIQYDEDSFIQQYGCILKETTKEYTCENVDSYLTKASDLDSDVLEQMKKQTKDSIKAYFAEHSQYVGMSGLKYAGYYFLTIKNSNGWSDYNRIYIIYSAKVKSKSKSFKTSTVYLPIKFSNIIKYAAGNEYVDLNSTSIQGSDTGLSFGWWSSVPGYKDVAKLKNDLVTSQNGTYDDEAGDGMK
jgi:hypothetical protein